MKERFRKDRRNWKSHQKFPSLGQSMATIVSEIVLGEETRGANTTAVVADGHSKMREVPSQDDVIVGMTSADAAKLAAAFPEKFRDRWERLKWLRGKT